MSDELISSLGPLPRQHGVLGAMLEQRDPYATGDIHEHPRFRGWWPDGHPDMRSFLGVPIVARDGVVGAFYLTEKIDAPDFTGEDGELITLLAAHAAIAIANARLHEETRELSIVAERNRLALDLHDAVSQKLFGLVLEAEAAATVLDRDPAAARERVGRLQELARDALDELGSLVFELRPPDLARDGLAGAPKHVEVLRRLGHEQVELTVSDEPQPDGARDAEVLRIAQEALQNALKHANAGRVAVSLSAGDGRLHLQVEDDGVGFDPGAPEVRSRRLGLTSMEERARRIGRDARDRLVAGRRHDRAAGGGRWLSRSASSSSTTTPSSARACAACSSCRTGSRSPGTPPTATRGSRQRRGYGRTWS